MIRVEGQQVAMCGVEKRKSRDENATEGPLGAPETQAQGPSTYLGTPSGAARYKALRNSLCPGFGGNLGIMNSKIR